jgi:hypothetical protein
MGHHVTLDLPPEVAERAQAVAAQSHRRVEDVLLEWLGRAATYVPVDLLPDEQVLALRDQQMSEDQQRELGDLLARQREGSLDASARHRLDELMDIYRRGMVQKAQALKVAVDRGLQPPLS